MSRRLQWSWFVLAAGALFGAEMARLAKPPDPAALHPVLQVLVTAYLFWAVYWGFPAFWRWASRHFHRISDLRHREHGWVLVVLALSVALAGGLYFSLFGGGIYQFAKAWRAYRP